MYSLQVVLGGDLEPGRHAFRIRQVDFDGTASYSEVYELHVSLLTGHLLSKAYPNPFAYRSRVELTLAEEQQVQIDVFDGAGRIVQTLHRGPLSGGAINTFYLSSEKLPPGLYFVRVQGERFQVNEKVIRSNHLHP